MTAPAVGADYFDGRSTRPHRVRVAVVERRLRIDGDAVQRTVPLTDVRWPERQRHGARVAHLPDGASLQAHDAAAWDTMVQAAGPRESWVVRAQQSWRATLTVGVLLLLVAFAGYRWGVPLAAGGVLAALPAQVDRELGESAFASIDTRWLQPSALPAAQQQRLRAAFERAVDAAYPAARPAYRVEFRRGGRLGPNAFALPGGIILLTDELVALVDGRDDVVVGVLAHELGHVRHRHGMRQLVQATLLGAAGALAFGDYSALLAAGPVLLGQLAYSRDAEREADGESIRVLRAAGLSPLAMATFFERIAARRRDRDEAAPGIALASHPPDAERLARFRDAAR